MVASAQNDTAPKQLSGVFKHVLAEHGEAFAQVKRLGMRSQAHRHSELERGREASVGGCIGHEHERLQHGPQRGEMVEGYAALRAIVQTEHLLENNARPSDLADAMAALDAINPGSPEWGPTFLQVSELVEAHLHEADGGIASSSDEDSRSFAAY